MELFPKHAHGSDSELIKVEENCQLIIFIDMYNIWFCEKKRRGENLVKKSYLIRSLYIWYIYNNLQASGL